MDTPENTRQDDTERNQGDTVTQQVRDKVTYAFVDEDFSSSDESDTNTDHPEDAGKNRRYPKRNRRQRTIKGSILWDSINVVKHKTL